MTHKASLVSQVRHIMGDSLSTSLDFVSDSINFVQLFTIIQIMKRRQFFVAQVQNKYGSESDLPFA